MSILVLAVNVSIIFKNCHYICIWNFKFTISLNKCHFYFGVNAREDDAVDNKESTKESSYKYAFLFSLFFLLLRIVRVHTCHIRGAIVQRLT